jgi:hypothetical protein
MLTLVQGPNQLILWPPPSVPTLTAHQFRDIDLARQGKLVWLFHGRLHLERHRRRTS